jgi:hypothetical protein
MRGSGATLRVAGRDYPASPSQAMRWSIADAQANAYIREVRRHDPSWRPNPGITSDDAEGWIRVREAQVEEAAARLRELGVRPPGPVPQERALRPGGRLIRWREGRASVDVRTCSPQDFRGLLEAVSPGAQQVLSRPSYKGLSYRQPNGSEFGLRWSERYGLTYDVITSNDYRPGFQGASKMTEEPTHWHYGTPMSEWMEQVANELPVDAVGMWQIVPAGRRGFKLEGEALTEYVRRQIGVLLSRGAVPVTGAATSMSGSCNASTAPGLRKLSKTSSASGWRMVRGKTISASGSRCPSTRGRRRSSRSRLTG